MDCGFAVTPSLVHVYIVCGEALCTLGVLCVYGLRIGCLTVYFGSNSCTVLGRRVEDVAL